MIKGTWGGQARFSRLGEGRAREERERERERLRRKLSGGERRAGGEHREPRQAGGAAPRARECPLGRAEGSRAHLLGLRVLGAHRRG